MKRVTLLNAQGLRGEVFEVPETATVVSVLPVSKEVGFQILYKEDLDPRWVTWKAQLDNEANDEDEPPKWMRRRIVVHAPLGFIVEDLKG